MTWKTIEFFVLAFTTIPIGIVICQFYQRFMYVVFAAMLLSTLFYQKLSITFFSYEWYKTVTWGIEVTAFDIGCVILFVAMFLWPNIYKIRWVIPLTIPVALYLLIQLISWLNVDSWTLNNPLKSVDVGAFEKQTTRSENFDIGIFPLFEMFKTLRFYFTLWVITNFIINDKALKTVTFMFAVLVLATTAISFFERYIQSIHQVTGGMGQTHLLNVYTGIMGCYLFSLSFAEEKLIKKCLFLCLFLCTVLTIILTIGRTALIGLGISSAILIVLSLIRFPTKLNLGMVILLCVASLLFLFKAHHSLIERFVLEDVSTTLEGRIDLNEVAMQMANNYPFGVGGGNFAAFYANSYLPSHAEPITLAHNIHYLNLAEYGYLGLFAFLLMQFRAVQILLTNIFHQWSHRKIIPYLIGILAGLMIIVMQDTFHFTSRHNALAALYLTLLAISSNIYLGRLKP